MAYGLLEWQPVARRSKAGNSLACWGRGLAILSSASTRCSMPLCVRVGVGDRDRGLLAGGGGLFGEID